MFATNFKTTSQSPVLQMILEKSQKMGKKIVLRVVCDVLCACTMCVVWKAWWKIDVFFCQGITLPSIYIYKRVRSDWKLSSSSTNSNGPYNFTLTTFFVFFRSVNFYARSHFCIQERKINKNAANNVAMPYRNVSIKLQKPRPLFIA